jgi:hypothetical protein
VPLRLIVDYRNEGANRIADELSRNFDRTLDASLGALIDERAGFHPRDVEEVVTEALNEWARGVERFNRQGIESPRSEQTSGLPDLVSDSSDQSSVTSAGPGDPVGSEAATWIEGPGPDELSLVDIEEEIFLSALRAGDRLRALGGSTRLLQARAWETYRAGLLRTGRPSVEWEPNEAAQDIVARGLVSYVLATTRPGHILAGAPVLVNHARTGPQGPIIVSVPSLVRRVPSSYDAPTEHEDSPVGTGAASPASASQPGPN